MTAVSSRFDRHVGHLVNVATARIQRQLDAKLREITKARQQAAAERGRRVHEEKAQREKAQKLLEQRTPLADAGLNRLLELSRNSALQQLIGYVDEGFQPYAGVEKGIVFFSAERPNGDAWDIGPSAGKGTRDIRILLHRQYASFEYGSLAAQDTTYWRVYHDAPAEKAAEWFDEHDRPHRVAIERFLSQISNPYEIEIALIRDEDQRELEWGPKEAMFEILIACARRKQFEEFTLEMFARLNH